MEVLSIMKIPLLAYHIFSLLFLFFPLIIAIRDIFSSDYYEEKETTYISKVLFTKLGPEYFSLL